MRHGILFLATGSLVLLFGFLLRTISFSNLLGHVPPYMGPPQGSLALWATRMFSFPYIFDTVSLAAFGISIGLILLGIFALSRKRRVHAKTPIRKRDFFNPYQ